MYNWRRRRKAPKGRVKYNVRENPVLITKNQHVLNKNTINNRCNINWLAKSPLLVNYSSYCMYICLMFATAIFVSYCICYGFIYVQNCIHMYIHMYLFTIYIKMFTWHHYQYFVNKNVSLCICLCVRRVVLYSKIIPMVNY